MTHVPIQGMKFIHIIQEVECLMAYMLHCLTYSIMSDSSTGHFHGFLSQRKLSLCFILYENISVKILDIATKEMHAHLHTHIHTRAQSFCSCV